MSILIATLFFKNLVGFLLFLFFYWRRLKEDYHSNLIFASGLLTALGGAIGILVALFLRAKVAKSVIFDPSGLFFWLAVTGAFVFFVFSVVRFNFRFFESFEAISVASFFWLFVMSPFSVFSLFVVFVILAFFFIDARYKRFTWYKSGKVGFSGLFSLGTLFFGRAVAGVFSSSLVISFLGRIDVLLSAVLSFAFFLMIYNLSTSE